MGCCVHLPVSQEPLSPLHVSCPGNLCSSCVSPQMGEKCDWRGVSQMARLHSSSSVSAVPLSPSTVVDMQSFWIQVDVPSCWARVGALVSLLGFLTSPMLLDHSSDPSEATAPCWTVCPKCCGQGSSKRLHGANVLWNIHPGGGCCSPNISTVV